MDQEITRQPITKEELLQLHFISKTDEIYYEIKEKYRAHLDEYDLGWFTGEKVNMEGLDFSKTNADHIDPQLVFRKSLFKTNLRGRHLEGKSFAGVWIAGADLSYTGAFIDINKVAHHDMRNVTAIGLDSLKDQQFNNIFGTLTPRKHITMEELCKRETVPGSGQLYFEIKDEYRDHLHEYDLSWFTGEKVFLAGLDFSKTNADNIDPQLVFRKYLQKANLRGRNLKGKSFDGVWIGETDLSYTDADIDPQTVFKRDMGCIAEGLDLSNKNFDRAAVRYANIRYTGAKIDPQIISNKDLRYSNLEGLDLSTANFDNVQVMGAKLQGTNAKPDPQRVLYKNYSNLDVNGLDLSEFSFSKANVVKSDLRNTNAKISPLEVMFKDVRGTLIDDAISAPPISLMYEEDQTSKRR